jgi:hypothetical protein
MPNIPVAEVKSHNGTPTVFIDGKPSFYHLAWFPSPARKNSDKFRKTVRAHARRTGVHLYTFDNGVVAFGSEGDAWIPGPRPGSDSHYDFGSVQRQLEQFLDPDPEAKFHLRLFLDFNADWDPNKWWSKLYPDECLVNSEGWKPENSFASTIWREQVKDFLRKFIAHIERIGLSDRILAYQINTGSSCEWFKYALGVGDLCSDFSPPMRRYFQSWLRKRYGNDEKALRKAWANSNVTFETAQIPSPQQQHDAKLCIFRDPATEQNVVDYLTAIADLSGELVIDFCRTAKEASRGRSMAGVFFGYWIGFQMNSDYFRDVTNLPAAHTRLQRTGHLGFHRTLLSPHVDFYSSPMDYAFRSIGGHCPAMQPHAAIRLHGKFYIQENDDRAWHGTNRDYGFCRNVDDFISVYRRTLADAITSGQGTWCTSVPIQVHKIERIKGDPSGMFHSIHMMDAEARDCAKFVNEYVACRKAGEFALNTDRTPCAEICVLLDDESFFYQTYKKNLELPLVHGHFIRSLPRLGAPFDTHILNDFIEGRLRPYKLYIFLNAFRLDDARRKKLKQQLRRDGRVALWLYGAGALNRNFSLENMTDLTGFNFAMTKTPWGPFMNITDFTHPITRGLPEDLLWGTDLNLSPTFYLRDPKAHILGNVMHAQGRCAEGFGVKEFPKWKSVFVAAPVVPAAVLRGIARYAGAHIYSDAGDVFFASQQLLAVHTVSGGKRVLRLPKTAEVVYDLFAHKTVAQNTKTIEVTLPKISTTMYYVGPKRTVASWSHK